MENKTIMGIPTLNELWDIIQQKIGYLSLTTVN